MSELKSLLEPISTFVATLDASNPEACERALNAKFPITSDAVQALAKAAMMAVTSGAICNRGEPNLKYSRVVKPAESSRGVSIDAVLMDDVAGPVHTHPNGEFCLCLPITGQPTFEARAATWIVMPKNSRHVPTVRAGKMLILYWLPQGACVFG